MEKSWQAAQSLPVGLRISARAAHSLLPEAHHIGRWGRWEGWGVDENKVRLGEAIRRAREAMSPPLTRDDLAAATHLHKRRIGAFERGDWDGIRPTSRDAIERALGWAPGSWDSVLAGGEPSKTAPQPVQRRRSDDEDDLTFVLTNADSLSPEKLHTLRLIIQGEIDRKS